MFASVRPVVVFVLMVVAALASATPGWAAAAKPLNGVALVIGETDYVRLPALVNPERDARDMERMLYDLGFSVERVLDVNSRRLQAALDDFVASAADADVALIYYSGHGIEAGGVNYIMGLDADISDAESAAATLIPIDRVLEELQKTVPVTIVLLDACRTNPFKPGQLLTVAEASAPLAISPIGLQAIRGPSPVASGAGKADSLGMVLGYSASPGQSALDGAPGANSPYALALLEHLTAGGYSFGDIMTMVAQEVYVDTGARQLPWTSSSLNRILYFGGDTTALPEDDAAIMADRRRLLLKIATAPIESKAFVEAVATQESLKLVDLYSMLDIIMEGEGASNSQDELLSVAKRVRQVLDDPLLAVTPTDPELARLDLMATKAIAQGAFKLAFKYRQQQAKYAAKLEKKLDQQQADIDAKRRELTAVYARVAEAAMYTLNTTAETEALKSAARQADFFDKSLSRKLRLRSADAFAQKAERTDDPRAGRIAVELYKDVLKEIDRDKEASLWASVQLRLGWALWTASNVAAEKDLSAQAADAARAALEVITHAKAPRDWSSATRLLAWSLADLNEPQPAYELLTKLIATDKVNSIDWSKDQQLLGRVTYDLGFTQNDRAMLEASVAAYGTAAKAFKRHDAYASSFATALKVYTAGRIALLTGDVAMMQAAIAEGREAIAVVKHAGKLRSNEAKMLGENMVAGGVLLADADLVNEGLKQFVEAKKVLSRKGAKADWARIRENEGDALQFLALRKAKLDKKRLNQALAAFTEAREAFDDIGWDYDAMLLNDKIVTAKGVLSGKIKPDELTLPKPAPIDISDATLTLMRNGARGTFEGFMLSLRGASLDGKPITAIFDMYTDYKSDDRIPKNIELVRIVMSTALLTDAKSRDADYRTCPQIAYQPGKVRLHYGRESEHNRCVLSKMAPADAAFWMGIWERIPALVARAAANGDATAQHILPLFEIKPAITATHG